jgi:hypothetical protein
LNVKLRHYTDQPGFTEDFIKVRDFLMRIHEPGHTDRNWLWARWEYMFSHPNLDETNLSRIGLWEDEGKLIALATYEDNIGATYFSLDSAYSYLKAEMLEYAIEYLSCASEDGAKSLRAVISDDDAEMRKIAVKHGLTLTERRDPMSEFRVSGPFPDIALPDGFSIVSLAEENDLYKIERAVWRGFNHPSEPPSDYIPGRLKMQSGPSFRKDLTIVVKAPNGDYASFCGFLDKTHIGQTLQIVPNRHVGNAYLDRDVPPGHRHKVTGYTLNAGRYLERHRPLRTARTCSEHGIGRLSPGNKAPSAGGPRSKRRYGSQMAR